MRINLRHNYAKILPMKLPTPRKRGDAYRIEIMIDGQRMSATRDTIKECHAWASRKLLESKAGQLSTADTRSQLKLGELMTIQYESSRRQSKGRRTDLDYQRMITRFVRVQKLPVEHVAKITGHKKIETLLNVYYNPTADELYDAMYGNK